MSLLPAKPAADVDIEWPPSNCYPLDILVDESSAKKFLCDECGQLARLAMAMDCDEHEDDQVAQSKLYGKECITSYLKTHENKCPLGGHANGIPGRNNFVRSYISQVICLCPRKAHALKNPSFRPSLAPSHPTEHSTALFCLPQKNTKDYLTKRYASGLGHLETSM